MKKKTWALAGAALVLAAVGLGAAKVALEPGLPPTSSADVGYRATDDREVAGHADELVWAQITGSSEHAPLFGGGPVRVEYRAEVRKAFKGSPPASVTVSVVYGDGDRTRMAKDRSYVIAVARGTEDGERWMLPGSVHVETPSLDAVDSRQGEHNASLREAAPANQGDRWAQAVARQIGH
ncbi:MULTISPECIES: hypothetical protein [unclassified Streptomyces]|uniref:hypothetical protein n=1 Tax=unclassified Streptomyces TaxID=2593676 RepID=UPI001BE87537|nr:MULTISPECIES: hypothetical protein [unclassified Streptomyces]MBT2407550.1 hypothetical protein [Streptomyces sp. ISL-21]MBT2459939.1 hypothetical protein [Streptomyces sp. ISL-86]MBT2608110.1 hypothetical protein [Streptomyces sp. ISL-87]